jgi:hypothetical protein
MVTSRSRSTRASAKTSQGDAGWVGGGGPASVIEDEKPTDEERHRPDTDHSVA